MFKVPISHWPGDQPAFAAGGAGVPWGQTAQSLPLRNRVRGLVFSVKTFAAAMLALYWAFALHLSHPYWALVTTRIVAHLLSGMMRSRVTYRFAGTLVGAVMAVVFVPALTGAPDLLILGLVLWVAVCLFFRCLCVSPLRLHRPLIAFPCLAVPGEVFKSALTRAEEITLGLICANLVGDLILPRRAGRHLMARLDFWLSAGGRWAGDVLSGHAPETAQKRFLAAAIRLMKLIVQASYDTPVLRSTEATTRALQARIGMLSPVIFGLADRLRALGPEKAGLSARRAGGRQPYPRRRAQLCRGSRPGRSSGLMI